MPPKKAANTNNTDAGKGGKFVWEGANDNKLLLLTQGRYVKPDEYEQLATAFPGATVGSIRNRISALRVKQRNMYEERGWDLPEGGAGHPAKKARATPTKRASAEESEPETPSKKPRVARKKQAKSQTPEHKVEGTDDEEAFGGVKSEPEEV